MDPAGQQVDIPAAQATGGTAGDGEGKTARVAIQQHLHLVQQLGYPLDLVHQHVLLAFACR